MTTESKELSDAMNEQLASLATVLTDLDLILTEASNNYNVLLLNKTFFDLINKFSFFYNALRKSYSEHDNSKYKSAVGDAIGMSPVFEKLLTVVYFFFTEHKEDKFVLSVDDKGNKKEHPSLQILGFITGAYHNYSDCSVGFCLALSSSEHFLKFYAEILTAWNEAYFADSLLFKAGRLLKKSMDFVYNCYFKNDTNVNSKLSRFDFLTPAKPYLHSPDAKTKFSALLLIIFAVDEKNADLYLAEKDNISHLINLLKTAHNTKSNRRADGYHVVELSTCIDRLAKNDVNKELLVELELLPVLKLMVDGNMTDEINCVLDILFTLSFNVKNQSRIQTGFGDILRQLKKDDRFKSSEELSGLSFLLHEDTSVCSLNENFDGEATTDVGTVTRVASAFRKKAATPTLGGKEGSAKKKPEGHIMISYQHENKAVVTQIKNELADKMKMKVWIDYEQMVRGSTIEAMAEAVEKADIVLLCMSRKYKESNNCRLEGEYAWRNQKHVIPLLMEYKYKPDGWLGLIMGTQLYYDFSGKYPFENKMSDLVKAIHLHKNTSVDSVDAVTLTSATKTTAAAAPPAVKEHHFPSPYTSLPPIPPRSIRSWTTEQFTKWCQEKKLPVSVQELNLTGEELYFLLTTRNRAPESFYRILDQRCPLSEFRALACFVNAMDEF